MTSSISAHAPCLLIGCQLCIDNHEAGGVTYRLSVSSNMTSSVAPANVRVGRMSDDVTSTTSGSYALDGSEAGEFEDEKVPEIADDVRI